MAFKLGQIEVPFSYFDVALLTGLPTIRRLAVFEQGEDAKEVELVLMAAMEETVSLGSSNGHYTRTCAYTRTTCPCYWSCANNITLWRVFTCFANCMLCWF